MPSNTRKIATLLMVFALIAGAAVGAVAISWDQETTDTSTQSDISGSTTTVTWYPGNSSKTLYVEVADAGTANHTLEISNGDADLDTVYYSNSTPDETNASQNFKAWSITHTELRSNLPSDYTGGTYDVDVINESTGKSVLSTELVLDFNGTETTARVYVENESSLADAIGNSLIAHSLDTETEEPGFLGSLIGSSNSTTASFKDNVDLDGNNTTVQFQMHDSDAATAFDEAAEERDDGEWMVSAQLWVDATPVKVYKNEAPDDAEGTYAVYDTETDRLTLTRGADFEDAQSISVTGVAGEGYAFSEVLNSMGIQDALGFQAAQWSPL